MDPKKIPFTDAYVKDQQSLLGANLLLAVGTLVAAVSFVLAFRGDYEPLGFVLGLILIAWASLAKLRLHTFHENLELYKMIQRLREDK